MSNDADNQDVRRFHADWLKAELDGEIRDLAFYIRRAREGDKDAATRAFQLCAASFAPESLAQNGGFVTPILAEVAREAFQFALGQPVSKLFDLRRRPLDHNRANLAWFKALEVHEHLQNHPDCKVQEACEVVLGELESGGAELAEGISSRTLKDHYGRLLPAIERYLEAEQQEGGDGIGRSQ